MKAFARFSILVLLGFLPIFLHAATSRLHFIADTNVKVSIYREIDRGYNDDIVQTETFLKAGVSHLVIMGMPDW